jgi:1-deoxy-D-xylulose-5-phosphate reductoisomerase
MVEFIDGSVISQMGMPDMRLPIHYALSYPERMPSNCPRLDFSSLSALTFEVPDTVNFPALRLAYEAGKGGGTMPCVFNAANEVAVYAFLNNEISFLDIPKVIGYTMESHTIVHNIDLNQIYIADTWARRCARQVVADFRKR